MISPKQNNLFLFAALLNLIWSISALIYDWPAIQKIPTHLWLSIIICPIFPFLLAIYWKLRLAKTKHNKFLLAFASVPSAVYFIGALIYYPYYMAVTGFNWAAFGQIFWVAFYGLQGFYILKKHQLENWPSITVFLFLVSSFFIQYHTKSYGYIELSVLENYSILSIYLVLTATSVFLLFCNRKKSRKGFGI